MIRYIDVCSGISAPTMAWKPLGWKALCFAEIEAAPRAILAHHYPDVPLNGDFTQIEGNEYGPVDLLVGGTPCQSFSVAGLRGGLADGRGNLALEFLRLADRARPRWLVWENVPGVLSSNGGRDFGSILGGMVELGYGIAYRVLDAQHFGVPQRRRRVFVVGYLGDWRRAAAVLFERHSLSGDTAPRRQAREGTALGFETGFGGGRHTDVTPTLDTGCKDGMTRNQSGFGIVEASTGNISHCLNAGGMGRQDYETETLITATLTSNGDAHSGFRDHNGLVPAVAFQHFQDSEFGCAEYDTAAIRAGRIPEHSMILKTQAVAFAQNTRDEVREMHVAGALAAQPGMKQQSYIRQASAVRRLTPRECERLQGFPDDFTLVPYRKGMMADGPRYKALGNSMAVPVLRWIGERIDMVEAIQAERLAA